MFLCVPDRFAYSPFTSTRRSSKTPSGEQPSQWRRRSTTSPALLTFTPRSISYRRTARRSFCFPHTVTGTRRSGGWVMVCASRDGSVLSRIFITAPKCDAVRRHRRSDIHRPELCPLVATSMSMASFSVTCGGKNANNNLFSGQDVALF